jgi:type VI secretion system secreted protein VgrG
MASLSNRLQANKRFEFASKAFGDDKFAVVSMEGFESISQAFRFELTLVSDDADIDFDKMLQNTATFRIFAPDGASSTPYHGILAEFDQLHQVDGYVFYRAMLVPRAWQLSLYQVSEVYLDEKPIPALIKKVLESAHFTSMDFELKTSGSYRDRSFVCQYQESHLDFLSRWMEKEGMYFWFGHEGDQDKLIIADSKTMHDAKAVAVNYRPADQLDTGVAPDSVQTFTCRQKPLPKQVILQDYNHRKAATQLKAVAPVADKGIGDVMLYGENFRDNQEGERYAKLRAEEILCGGKVFSGESTAVGLRSGYFMQLAHHYRDAFNGKYLVTEVEHRGSQAGALLNGIRSPFSNGNESTDTSYSNSFRAIGADVQFRPQRVTQKPRVAGAMSATIDSEGSGEYAELDEFGQYKVQLPFDQTDKTANHGSARVRMATPYSGSNHGMHFPLHKNAEVLLSFTDGDPDQPVIVGAVPNSENRNVVDEKKSHENRISTAGGNQIYMGDSKGKEVMWLHSPFHNSTIGVGSVDAKGGGSIWTSTAGSSMSVTVGSSNSIFAGEKNSLSVSFDNTLSASFATKFALGTSVNFTAGQDISWKFGRGITIDDSETVSLKTEAKLQANENVLISGGQREALGIAMKALKKSVQKATTIGTAVNLALGAGAGAAISLAPTTNKDTGKSPSAWDPWGGGVTGAHALAAGISTGVMHGLLGAAGKAIAATAKSAAYGSNIKVGGSGIDMVVDSLIPVTNGRVNIKSSSVEISSRLGIDGVPMPNSTIDVHPRYIEMIANGMPATTGTLRISDTAAELSTNNPAGKVTLSQPAGGSLVIDSGGLLAKSAVAGTGLMQVRSDRAMLECTSGTGFVAKPNKVTASLMESASMELTSTGASLKYGNATLTMGPAGATVNGALIKLG